MDMSAVLDSDVHARRWLAELVHGGDARTLAPYGLPLPASNALVAFGSCTANPITPDLLARHAALQERGSYQDPERHLRDLFGAAQCKLAASGTDAEYTGALAMGAQPYCSILIDPSEVGSGCMRAAAGLAHVTGCPVQAPLPVQAHIETPRLRDAQGRALTQAEVDEQVYAIVARHPRLPILLHHVACSKTGLSAPSEAACLSVQRDHGPGARVIVDASQGRFSLADVRRWLGYGWAVIITGSKYLGAPPFCGATLLPEGWPVAQGFAVGPGLRARWRLALRALGAPQPDREAWRQALEDGFVRTLNPLWVDAGAALERQGILSFDLGLDAERSRALHRALIGHGFFIGQPVSAGARTLLRVALGVHTRLPGAMADLQRLARLIHHLQTHA